MNNMQTVYKKSAWHNVVDVVCVTVGLGIDVVALTRIHELRAIEFIGCAVLAALVAIALPAAIFCYVDRKSRRAGSASSRQDASG